MDVPATPVERPHPIDAAMGDAPVISPLAEGPAELERISSDDATRLAKAAGLKASLGVPYPVRCPTIAPPTVDVKRFEATGALAGLVIDIDGFLSTDFGIAAGVALLGPPALCNHEARSGYSELHLGPRLANVHAATLETYDDDLIGVVVELEKPVEVDITALAARFGKPRKMPGPLDSHEAGSEVFDVKTPAFSAMLMFARRSRSDPQTRRNIHQIIFRRTAMIEILPDRFTTANDLARLVALALRPRAPEPVSFYGTLGVYDTTTGDHVALLPAAAMRNVARASIEKRTRDGRDFTQTMSITFATPIATDPAMLATAIAQVLRVPAPLTIVGTRADIAVAGRGVVHAEIVNSTVTSLTIERVP